MIAIHPGEYLTELIGEGAVSLEVVEDAVGHKVDVGALLNGDAGITVSVALTLSEVVGRSPESWVAMQKLYDQQNPPRFP